MAYCPCRSRYFPKRARVLASPSHSGPFRSRARRCRSSRPALEFFRPKTPQLGMPRRRSAWHFMNMMLPNCPSSRARVMNWRRRMESELKAAKQFSFSLFRGFDHFLALGRSHRHRFFGDHMRAALDASIDAGRAGRWACRWRRRRA